MSKPRVTIYTKDPCPYCVRAIQLLDEHKIPYQEIDLTAKPEEIERLKKELGWKTVPMIMIDDQLVGGYTDLKALEDEGKLEALKSH